jgi:hypothetical protein
LTADPGANLLLSRLPHPLGTCTRILVFFPPEASATEGFAGAIGLIEHLAKQLGAPLLLLGHESEREPLQQGFTRAHEPVRSQFVFYPAFRLWLPVLTEHIGASDLLVLYGLRQSDAHASAESKGLAQRIATRFETHNLIVLYPAKARRPDRLHTSSVPAHAPAIDSVDDTTPAPEPVRHNAS